MLSAKRKRSEDEQSSVRTLGVFGNTDSSLADLAQGYKRYKSEVNNVANQATVKQLLKKADSILEQAQRRSSNVLSSSPKHSSIYKVKLLKKCVTLDSPLLTAEAGFVTIFIFPFGQQYQCILRENNKTLHEEILSLSDLKINHHGKETSISITKVSVVAAFYDHFLKRLRVEKLGWLIEDLMLSIGNLNSKSKKYDEEHDDICRQYRDDIKTTLCLNENDKLTADFLALIQPDFIEYYLKNLHELAIKFFNLHDIESLEMAQFLLKLIEGLDNSLCASDAKQEPREDLDIIRERLPSDIEDVNAAIESSKSEDNTETHEEEVEFVRPDTPGRNLSF